METPFVTEIWVRRVGFEMVDCVASSSVLAARPRVYAKRRRRRIRFIWDECPLETAIERFRGEKSGFGVVCVCRPRHWSSVPSGLRSSAKFCMLTSCMHASDYIHSRLSCFLQGSSQFAVGSIRSCVPREWLFLQWDVVHLFILPIRFRSCIRISEMCLPGPLR